MKKPKLTHIKKSPIRYNNNHADAKTASKLKQDEAPQFEFLTDELQSEKEKVEVPNKKQEATKKMWKSVWLILEFLAFFIIVFLLIPLVTNPSGLTGSLPSGDQSPSGTFSFITLLKSVYFEWEFFRFLKYLLAVLAFAVFSYWLIKHKNASPEKLIDVLKELLRKLLIIAATVITMGGLL